MKDYIWIKTLDELKDFCSKFKSKEFAFDTEFTSLSWYDQRLIGMSVYDRNSGLPSAFIQFNFWYKYWEKIKNPAGGRKKITKWNYFEKTDAIEFEDAKPYLLEMFDGAKCATANGKVEWKIFKKYGIDNWEIEHDVNMMAWMLNVNDPKGLKPAAKKYLGLTMTSYESTIKQKADNINWNLVDFEEYARYGALDAWATEELKYKLYPSIEEYPSMVSCYKNIEIPLIYCVAQSEMDGVNIDVPYLKELSIKADMEIKKSEELIYDECGVNFNIGSPKQLAEVLFDRLGCPVIEKSEKTGARSVNENTLKELAFMGYDVADDILEYRKLKKLKGTYIDAIPEMIDEDGRLRGNFNAMGTKTGRFSSSNPNLQNQPNNKDFPVKRAFIPKKGYKFCVYDWSTIEVRIMAHESKDPKMIEIFTNYRDIHQETTDNVNARVGTKLDRGQGKTINFGVLYLMGAQALAFMLNKALKKAFRKGDITRDEYDEQYVTEAVAQSIIDGYFDTYVGFTQFIKDETAFVKHSGWSWTLGGRRRPVPELNWKGKFGEGRRKAVNTPIQGGAGDLIKLAIIKLFEYFWNDNIDATCLLYVHDELVVEVREDLADEVSEKMKFIMENVFPDCIVPIIAEGGIFDDWAGLKQGGIDKLKNHPVLNTYADLYVKNILLRNAKTK
tara:strand:+ start:58294 stop:60303 length:2010 start_codon:yes stop_codon:yes gene_type:complete